MRIEEEPVKISLIATAFLVGAVLVTPVRAEDMSGPNLSQQVAAKRVAELLLALGLPDLKKANSQPRSRSILPVDTICKQPETCCCRVAPDRVSCQEPSWCAALNGQCVEQTPPYPVVVNCE